MCEFCNEENTGMTPINDTVDYSGIEISMSKKGMIRARYYPNLNTSDPFETQDIALIKYCPMCGRKLNLV